MKLKLAAFESVLHVVNGELEKNTPRGNGVMRKFERYKSCRRYAAKLV